MLPVCENVPRHLEARPKARLTVLSLGFLLTSDRSLCILVMNFSRSVAASTFAPILSTSRWKKRQFRQKAVPTMNIMNLVCEQGAEGGRVLHDQRCDGQKWEEEHVHLGGETMN